jgi:hypothetical protein
MENYTEKQISENGNVFYCNIKGRLHRLDGPAIVWSNGSKEWHINGKTHRVDGPALIYVEGIRQWYINGEPMFKVKHNRLILFSILEPKRMDLNPTEDW